MDDSSIARIRLQKMLLRRKVPHALLFTGPSETEIQKIAHAFAEKVICLNDPKGIHLAKLRSGNHPDLHLFRPEGKTGMHTIQSLRSLSDQAAFAPHEAERQCFLIYHADRMLPTSSNALLKTLEEPPPKTIFILFTQFPDRILPTILSRCQRFPFGMPISYEASSSQTKLLDSLPDRLTSSLASELADTLDKEKKGWEKELRPLVSSDFSLIQREAIEKEIEGILSLRYQEKANGLFHTILQWYRDRFVLELKLSTEYLLYPDRLTQLQKTSFFPLSYVEEAVTEASLGIERSIKLNTCLEALFLKLSP